MRVSVIYPFPKVSYSTLNPYFPAFKTSVNVSSVPLSVWVTVETMVLMSKVL